MLCVVSFIFTIIIVIIIYMAKFLLLLGSRVHLGTTKVMLAYPQIHMPFHNTYYAFGVDHIEMLQISSINTLSVNKKFHTAKLFEDEIIKYQICP